MDSGGITLQLRQSVAWTDLAQLATHRQTDEKHRRLGS